MSLKIKLNLNKIIKKDVSLSLKAKALIHLIVLAFLTKNKSI